MIIHRYIYLLLFYTNVISGIEYIYPVASLNNGNTVLYIHQKNSDTIELFEWNSATHTTQPLLWSVYNPAGIQLLPHNKGFSFIDNGRLRIKLFEKRMPKTVDFDEPLWMINNITWINEHECYCSAQNAGSIALFQLHDTGIMQCLMTEQHKDCIYPQKINDTLFYIERSYSDTSDVLHYRIMCTIYGKSDVQPTMIIDYEITPLAFLQMQSEHEGFVIEHQPIIDSTSPVTLFSYYHLIRSGILWKKHLLFSFAIPTPLLLQDHQERLYESLLPLLPRLIGTKIFFVDAHKGNNYYLEPYFYDLKTEKIKKLIVPLKKDGHYFVPIRCGKKLYCGGTKNDLPEPFVCVLT